MADTIVLLTKKRILVLPYLEWFETVINVLKFTLNFYNSASCVEHKLQIKETFDRLSIDCCFI